eukprot:CAMPEP_0184688512 /NCGR_PEP_ID=MMETSP0312-20130426/30139_1 /TAXON_ID=31354 /ORGANISM="Compsopogon coeruleus, Strain SAG 36.94" /LENGTH=489 /DNA_ID=CAMNT_0027145759 /DNA_START=61 /DNA_END=1530 /DNA_ORIENTATION=+
MTLRKKHKIEKKVREHHRKVRKEGRLNGGGGVGKRRRGSADLGIPNLFPYKEEMIRKLEEQRAAGKVERRVKKRSAAVGGDGDGEREEAPDAGGGLGSRAGFVKEFNRLVESSDVVLEVLDARDPMGCRCLEAERRIMAASGGSKRIVLVLNKVDLVPREVTEKWLQYLRNEYPTVPFRASLQHQRSALGHGGADVLHANALPSSECLGAQDLIQLLKNYCRSLNLKKSIAVGVVGLPNVGKSSIINSLKRARATKVGPTPGLTRALQEVHIDDQVRLIDSPGIILSKSSDNNALVLRNCVRIEQLADPISPVEAILKRCGHEALMHAYSLPIFKDVTEFLALVAKKRGKVMKGGRFDLNSSAKIVLQDWNNAKIPFYTLPPLGPKECHLSAQVVNEWAKEFDVNNGMVANDRTMLDRLPEPDLRTRALYAQLEASAPGESLFDGEGDVQVRDREQHQVSYAIARRPETMDTEDDRLNDDDFDFNELQS